MILALFLLFSTQALALEERFEDFDVIDRQEQNISDEFKPDDFTSENVLDIQSVLKLNGQFFINELFSSIKAAAKDVEETNNNVNDLNKPVEDFDTMRYQLETRMKFNLYDDIRFDVPVTFGYSGFYPVAALSALGDFDRKLSRIIDVKVGLWFDWYAVSFFKLGIRGGQDDYNGDAVLFRNKLYNANGHESGFDVLDWNVLFFGEFRFSPVKWFRFEPEIRLVLENGYVAIGSAPRVDTIFALKLLTPLKFAFDLLEDLRLNAKFNLIADKAFSGSSSASYEKFGIESGYGLGTKLAVELEYSIMKTAKIRLPLIADFKARFFSAPAIAIAPPAIKLVLRPSVEVDFALFQNVYLVLDGELDYKFFKASFGQEIKTSFLASPVFKWGIGFRYDSSY